MSIFPPNDTNASASADLVKTFLALLDQADSVRVDGQLLDDWNALDACGNADKEVVQFTWVDDEANQFTVELTEDGVAAGQWKGDIFLCNDSEGSEVQISLHRHVALTPHQSKGA